MKLASLALTLVLLCFSAFSMEKVDSADVAMDDLLKKLPDLSEISYIKKDNKIFKDIPLVEKPKFFTKKYIFCLGWKALKLSTFIALGIYLKKRNYIKTSKYIFLSSSIYGTRETVVALREFRQTLTPKTSKLFFKCIIKPWILIGIPIVICVCAEKIFDRSK